MTENILEIDDMPFEEAMAALTNTVMQLEAGDLSLEASLELYERGQALSKRCQVLLESAVLKVEQLSADGEIIDRSPE